ncbi:MAG: hypothetical protein EBX40_00180 [Gammaproteobacteria bacterium]|nr:hypothetical protein [Gammaproteobacteria bacterium]
MAAPPNRTFIEGQMLDQHAVEIQNKAQRAASAYMLLNNYNWNSTGAMPSPISWTAPTTREFRFDNSLSELYYNSTGYSSMTSQEKREFFQYLPKFIQYCLDVYDDTYNL